jgi:hypothetical protein
MMRHAVLLAIGKWADEKARFSTQEGPRTEFCEIAKVLRADIHSYASGAAKRGAWFRWLFRSRKIRGSAFNIALYRNRYGRIYATGEDIGFRAALLLKLLGWRVKMICLVHNMSRLRKWLLRIIEHQPFRPLAVVSKSQIQPIWKSDFRTARSFIFTIGWMTNFLVPRNPVAIGSEGVAFVACGAENKDYETLRRATDLVAGHTYVFGHGFLDRPRMSPNENTDVSCRCREFLSISCVNTMIQPLLSFCQ